MLFTQAQGVLSKSMSSVTSPGATVKALASAHPVIFGITIGISAYYAVNKYWLDKDEDESEEEITPSASDETDEEATTA